VAGKKKKKKKRSIEERPLGFVLEWLIDVLDRVNRAEKRIVKTTEKRTRNTVGGERLTVPAPGGGAEIGVAGRKRGGDRVIMALIVGIELTHEGNDGGQIQYYINKHLERKWTEDMRRTAGLEKNLCPRNRRPLGTIGEHRSYRIHQQRDQGGVK